jgi:flagellar basal body-associated protein FliL
MYNPQKPPNRKLLLIVGITTLVLIIIIVVADIVMWTSNKLLYKPYTPPPTPSSGIAPNGNPNDPSSGIQAINPTAKNGISENLGNYKSKNPGTDPFQFGFYNKNP